jgi:hypothetical protein
MPNQKNKTASLGLAAALGLGAASHVGTNVVVRALRKGGKSKIPFLGKASKKYHNWEKGSMGQGIRDAVAGKKRSRVATTRDLLVAPELSNSEHVGRQIGDATRGMSKGRRYRSLKKLRKSVASNPQLRDSAEIGPLVGGINRALKSPLPNVGKKETPKLLDKITPYAALAGVSAVKPPALVHAGVNRARMAAASSKPGKQYFRDQAKAGAKGNHPSKAKQLLQDLAISPAVADPRKASSTLAEFAKSNPREAARFATALVPGGAAGLAKKHKGRAIPGLS